MVSKEKMVIKQSLQAQKVYVNAFARLHMGFLDLNATQGRRFGSVGLGLDMPDTLLEMAIGHNVFDDKLVPTYVNKYKQLILDHLSIKKQVSIKVHREIPRHFGLGSGTQMALAVGAGISRLFNLNTTSSDIALFTKRGLRSGVGIGTFANGGLVIDAGRGEQTVIPQIIFQQPFPSEWRILLIFDYAHEGLHGDEEKKAFAKLQVADIEETYKVNYQILMRALPALKERDLKVFGDAISTLQAYTGDYFAPAQGGRYASQLITEVITYLSGRGISCLGQSSWGPTGFAIFENESIAKQYLSKLQTRFSQKELGWLICRARNMGAVINNS
jgi:beta-ribofuranosylaminobenzene 5'-phosphate synthase